MVSTLIVGAGTSGCLLAARLSADPDHDVRLVEAGPTWSSAAEMPPEVLRADLMPIGPASPYVWRYPARLAPEGLGRDAGEVTAELVRGRLLGGSGAINGSYFVRALAADFRAWSAGLGGSSEWSWDAVSGAYRSIERDHDFGAEAGHGSTGPIPVRRVAAPAPLSVEFGTAVAAAGFPDVPDLNAAPDTVPSSGFGPVPCNVEAGLRVGTATACLLPVLARPNLVVTGGVLVTRIRFEGARAVGVDCRVGATTATIGADRVVLCAGAVESAALLLRSGIGDPSRLRALGIPVVHPAPVGESFVDHPEIGLEFHLAGRSAPPNVPLEYVLTLDDIEIRPYTVPFTSDPDTHRIGVALMRPRATGELRIRTADPDTAPVLEHRYLSCEFDRDALRTAVELAVEVVGAIPGARLSAAWGARGGGVDTARLRANLGTSQHLAGTCRMGVAGDERAVVDDRCRVHGVTGLSVVDLSVAPVPLSRGPQATVMMIAEHASSYFTS